MKQKLLTVVVLAILLSFVVISAIEPGVDSDSNIYVGSDDADVEAESNSNANYNKGVDIKSKDSANVNAKSNYKRVLEISGIDVETDLNVETDSNSEVHVKLSNGKNAEIKVMPVTASETAIARLRLNVCSEESGCEIVLKEVGQKNETKATYEVKAKKMYKAFGLFKARADVKAYVDA